MKMTQREERRGEERREREREGLGLLTGSCKLNIQIQVKAIKCI